MSTNVTKMRVKGVFYTLNGKLYDTTGSNVDGSMTQASITSEINDVKEYAQSAYALAEQVLEDGKTVIEGNVTNNPDEEDISTVINTQTGLGELKLKNRAYISLENTKGYVILRKDDTLSNQLSQTNTIYEVRYDFDLNGSTINIPNGTVFNFNGGKIFNGTLTGNSDMKTGNVLDFGGANNFSTAVQNMIAIGIRDIVVPHRSEIYEVTNRINLDSNVQMRGIGGKPIIGSYNNRSDLMMFRGLGTEGSHLHDISFNNLHFTFGTPTTARVSGTVRTSGVFFFEYVDNVTFENVSIIDVFAHHNIYFSISNNIIVRDCEFRNTTYAMLGFLKMCQNILVDNCIFDTCTTMAKTHSYLFCTGEQTNEEFRCKNIVIRNSHFKNNPRWEGIDSHGVRNMLVENNTIENCLSGIMIRVDMRNKDTFDMDQVIIKNNNINCTDIHDFVPGPDDGFYGPVSNGIIVGGNFDKGVTDEDYEEGLEKFLMGRNIVIERNTVQGARHGIQMTYSINGTIRDNYVYDCCDSGISVTYSFRVLVDNNVVNFGSYNPFHKTPEEVVQVTALDVIASQAITITNNSFIGIYDLAVYIPLTACYLYKFENNKISANHTGNLQNTICSEIKNIDSLASIKLASSSTLFAPVSNVSNAPLFYTVGDSEHIRSNGGSVTINDYFTLSDNILTYNNGTSRIYAVLAFDEEFELVYEDGDNVQHTIDVFVKDILDPTREMLSPVDTSDNTVLSGTVISMTKKRRKFVCSMVPTTSISDSEISQSVLDDISNISTLYNNYLNSIITVKDHTLYDTDGYEVSKKSGTDSNRPVSGSIGMSYFDTSLGKTIWLKDVHLTTKIEKQRLTINIPDVSNVEDGEISLTIGAFPSILVSVPNNLTNDDAGKWEFIQIIYEAITNLNNAVIVSDTGNTCNLISQNDLESVSVKLSTTAQRIEITGRKIGSSLRSLVNTDNSSTTKIKVTLSNPSKYPDSWKNWMLWVDENGIDMTDVTSVRGETSTRTAMTLTESNAGLTYYDTTLLKYVIWNGTDWTNLDGTALV